MTTAAAQSACTNVSTVTASGYSTTDAEGATALRQSVAQALAAAIAQVNGTLLRHETSIETTIITRLTANAFTDDVIDEFSESIEQTTAGFVTGFEILTETREHGLKRVDLLVHVCADPRASLSFAGDTTASSALEAVILPYLQAAGWRASVTRDHRAPERAIDALLETGATLHLNITATPTGDSEYRGLRHVQLSVTGNLTDLASAERSQAYALTTEGVGVNLQSALQDAGARAANELTRIFQATWALSESLNPSGLNLNFDTFNTAGPTRLTFTGVTQANTLYEVEALIERTPSITLQGEPNWDQAAHTLTFTAQLRGDACDTARSLENARRILLLTRECTATNLELHVRRE